MNEGYFLAFWMQDAADNAFLGLVARSFCSRHINPSMGSAAQAGRGQNDGPSRVATILARTLINPRLLQP